MRKALPIVLTIAGSDSGGGAGIQADLKTFTALRVHGTCVVTCITAQNPRRVTGIQAVRPAIVDRQIAAVFDELPPVAVKTGMLYSTEIIRTVARRLAGRRRPSLVVDPVMVSTSGARLLKPSAIRVLQDKLLPLAALVTPNLDEAAILVGRRLKNIQDLHDAAREIHNRFGCAVLVKGGHLRRAPAAIDVYFDGTVERELSARFVRGVSTHGTGCTYSAAIVGYIGRGHALLQAVELAKVFITKAIAKSYLAGRHTVLNTSWR